MTPSERLLLQALEGVTHEICRITTKICAFLLSGEEAILEFCPEGIAGSQSDKRRLPQPTQMGSAHRPL